MSLCAVAFVSMSTTFSCERPASACHCLRQALGVPSPSMTAPLISSDALPGARAVSLQRLLWWMLWLFGLGVGFLLLVLASQSLSRELDGELYRVERRLLGALRPGLSEASRSSPPGACRGFQGLLGGRRGGQEGFLEGQTGKVFEAILDRHKTRNTLSCGVERTTVTQNSEGGGFRKSPQ